jgi:hypothetical protein
MRRAILFTVIGYLAATAVAGVLLCDGALHPMRRPLTSSDQGQVYEMAERQHATVQDTFLLVRDQVTLRAWLLSSHSPNGNTVVLLHGLSDNRIGMMGWNITTPFFCPTRERTV